MERYGSYDVDPACPADERDVINIIADRTMERTVHRLYGIQRHQRRVIDSAGTVLPEGGLTLIKDQLGGSSVGNERSTVNDSWAAATFRHFYRAGPVAVLGRQR